MFKIKKDLPPPADHEMLVREAHPTYPLHLMEPGDSFDIVGKTTNYTIRGVRQAISKWAAKHRPDWVFVAQFQGENPGRDQMLYDGVIRVWRTK